MVFVTNGLPSVAIDRGDRDVMREPMKLWYGNGVLVGVHPQ